MGQPENEINRLIASSLSGNSTPADNEHLEAWRNSSTENDALFSKSLKAWNAATSGLSDHSIEEDKQEVKDRIIEQSALQRQSYHRKLRLIIAAAAVLVPLFLPLGWYFGNAYQPGSNLAWNSVTAPKKHIAVFNMADGSEIWLNAGSTLSYPSENLKERREVKLSGEAYFKIARNAKKPFIVITDRATVKVLGTTFDMKAYPSEQKLVTTLEEGSIALYTDESKTNPNLLHPGEQAILDFKSNSLIINKVDPLLFSSWKGERYVFRDADLKTILTELERLYDIKIHINNPGLENKRFRGMFSYDEDLLDAFETLKHSVKMSYTIKGREVWLE